MRRFAKVTFRKRRGGFSIRLKIGKLSFGLDFPSKDPA